MSAVPAVFRIKSGAKSIISSQASFYYHIRRLRAKACEITEREDTLPQKQEVVPVSFAEQKFCIPPT